MKKIEKNQKKLKGIGKSPYEMQPNIQVWNFYSSHSIWPSFTLGG